MSPASAKAPLGAVAFTAAPVALCVSRGGRIAECNGQFVQLFRLPPDRVVGMALATLCRTPLEFRHRRRDCLQRLARDAEGREEWMLRRADGRDVMCRVSVRPTGTVGLMVWMVEELRRHAPDRELSPREREVAELLLRGQTAKQMARCMGLSPRTVEMHRANLMKKFAASTTPALVALLSGGA